MSAYSFPFVANASIATRPVCTLLPYPTRGAVAMILKEIIGQVSPLVLMILDVAQRLAFNPSGPRVAFGGQRSGVATAAHAHAARIGWPGGPISAATMADDVANRLALNAVCGNFAFSG